MNSLSNKGVQDMFKFSHSLMASVDENDIPTIAFCVNETCMGIHDPSMSECGRFEVDPLKAYGLTQEDIAEFEKLKKLIDQATEDALNSGCYALQKGLGIETGDMAGIYFSDAMKYSNIKRDLIDYVVFEYLSEHGH